MKNRRTILFLLACCLMLSTALVLLSKGRHLRSDASSVGRALLNVEKVSAIELNRETPLSGKSEHILISRTNGNWRIEAPFVAEADEGAIKHIIDSVAFAEPVDELSDSDMASLGRSPQDFGLSHPCVMVVLHSDDMREMFEFGRNTPSRSEVYVRRNGKGGIFTVPINVITALTKPIGALRRRRLFKFNKMDVAMIGLKNAGGKLSKLVKGKDGWRLTEPMDAPADRAVVEELIGAFCATNVIDYADVIPNLAHGLGENEGYTISFRDTFGAVEKLVLGAFDSTNTVWALTTEGAVVHVDAGLLSLCHERQRMLEDTRVFPVDMQSVVSFSVIEGYPSYMLSRQNATAPWRLISPVDAPADVAAVTNLLSSILALRGVDLAPMSTPSKIELSLVTESTNFPSCVVSSSFLQNGVRLADLRDKTLMRYPQTEIKRIRVDTAAGSGWDATKAEFMLGLLESGIVAESVDTVVLRQDDFERCGLGHPSYTLTFELYDRSSALRKLLLGAAAPGGGRFAMIGGSDAIFVLSAATVSTLTKPVEDTLGEGDKK